jgi:hypothetical protein
LLTFAEGLIRSTSTVLWIYSTLLCISGRCAKSGSKVRLVSLSLDPSATGNDWGLIWFIKIATGFSAPSPDRPVAGKVASTIWCPRQPANANPPTRPPPTALATPPSHQPHLFVGTSKQTADRRQGNASLHLARTRQPTLDTRVSFSCSSMLLSCHPIPPPPFLLYQDPSIYG